MVTVTNAHFVGSINQPDAESVFRAVAEHVGDRTTRIPDGEVGERFESYAKFAELRASGAIPAGARFQVSIPTPVGVVGAFIVPGDREAVEPAYEEALFAEVARIADAIPHEDLAIQWDAAVEFGILEGAEIGGVRVSAGWGGDLLGGIVDRALRQIEAVPDDVQVGFHLCCGDIEEQHFIQPKDAGTLAAVIRGIVAASPRTVNWFHLPVPIERDDTAYFAPLADLDLPEGTEIDLGLLHHEDGVEGAERRIAAAATVFDSFGVGTECGFGRGPAERTEPLLELHAAVVDAHR